jgi:hypothetical protein
MDQSLALSLSRCGPMDQWDREDHCSCRIDSGAFLAGQVRVEVSCRHFELGV